MFAGGGLGGGGVSSGRGMGSRPAFRTCYLCGQQFGSASIGIHVPQCYQKKLAQWQNANPSTRGNKPKDPNTVNWQGNGAMTKRRLDDEQYREFSSNLSPCPNCGRTFAPDRLPVHLRGCKGSASSARTSTAAGKAPRSSQGSGGAATSVRLGSTARPASMAGSMSPSQSQSRRSVSTHRDKGMPPPLPFCYLCGRQFGTTSLNIHVPQCYAKKLAQWQSADPAKRGKAPKHPDEVEATAESMSTKEQSEAQFQDFVSNLEPCPNCARRFLPNRLVVHLRSCRPGNSAKPVQAGPHAAASASAKAALPVRTAPSATSASAGQRPGSAGLVGDDANASTDDEVDRVHPRRNRIPKNSSIPRSGVTCPKCAVVEYDEKAKFCRECGHNLRPKTMTEPCTSCGDDVPEGSRFCPTCGEPVNGAAARERRAGAQNENAPTARVIVCPACEAICDEDGNFCDNCGAMVETANVADGASHTSRSMYCESCQQSVADMTLTFCEDCGAKLVFREEAAPQRGCDSDARRPAGASPAAKSDRSAPAKPKTGTAATVKGSSSVGKQNQPNAFPDLPEDAFEEDFSYRQQCPRCGRKFAPEAYERHVNVCTSQKKRPTFNMTKQRLADVADPKTIQKVSKSIKKAGTSQSSAVSVPKKDWRAESRAFRQAMREARQVDVVLKSGGTAASLPPPTYSENAHYVQCPHCTRRFAPDVAERHIPRCATTMNKPKPPPRRRI